GLAHACVDDVDDVRVADSVYRLSLLKEALRDLRVVDQLRPEELDGDRAAREDVVSAVDVTHAAAADALGEAVLLVYEKTRCWISRRHPAVPVNGRAIYQDPKQLPQL